MWHASVSAPKETAAWVIAERVLAGVGDKALGEWREVGVRAVHLRRRLSNEERRQVGGMEVRDIRGTPEEAERLAALFEEAPHLRGLL